MAQADTICGWTRSMPVIAFTRQRPFPVILIIGATDTPQLDHILAGLSLRLTDEALSRIAISPRITGPDRRNGTDCRWV